MRIMSFCHLICAETEFDILFILSEFSHFSFYSSVQFKYSKIKEIAFQISITKKNNEVFNTLH